MYISLYSKDSKFYEPMINSSLKLYSLPSGRWDNPYVTVPWNFKCNKRYSFFGFKYEKEKEAEIEPNDKDWNIQLYLNGFKYNPCIIKVDENKKVWTQLTESDEPIEWNLSNVNDLQKLHDYIMKHSSWDPRAWRKNETDL